MNYLTIDIWAYICDFIKNNKTKCKLLMTCKGISKYDFSFTQPIKIKKIMKSRWFHHFTKIISNRNIIKYPSRMTYLKFSDDFNYPIKTKIPSSVNYLIFGKNFNQDVYCKIPSTVKNIKFGKNFNKCLCKCLSFGLKHLIFGDSFECDVSKCVPSSVTHLTIGKAVNPHVDDYELPPSITHLTFNNACYIGTITCIPTSVKRLIFRNDCVINEDHCVPNSVTCLKFLGSWYQRTFSFYRTLPSSVTHLTIGYSQYGNFDASMVPSSVTHLSFTDDFDASIIGYLPSSITHLEFGNDYDQPIIIIPDYWAESESIIPDSVTHLKFGNNFSKPIKNLIPLSVKHLILPNNYNHPIFLKEHDIKIQIIDFYKLLYGKAKSRKNIEKIILKNRDNPKNYFSS